MVNFREIVLNFFKVLFHDINSVADNSGLNVYDTLKLRGQVPKQRVSLFHLVERCNFSFCEGFIIPNRSNTAPVSEITTLFVILDLLFLYNSTIVKENTSSNGCHFSPNALIISTFVFHSLLALGIISIKEL